jgi:hypothetical protein
MLYAARILVVLLLTLSTEHECFSFQHTTIMGTVRDTSGIYVRNVSVKVLSTGSGTYTDESGTFSLIVPEDGSEKVLVFSCVGYLPETRMVKCDRDTIILNITLKELISSLGEVTVNAERKNISISSVIIPVKDISLLPSASGSFEAILKTMPGVTSNNELSSQYSVRGGNYDENLVYVNDIEIFRPFLIRSGQQEGLSFINPDLVSSVNFSSGGFGAAYGDKLSSVLDIHYRKPVSDKGTVSPGLLISSAHLEGVSKNKKFTWLIGARYKSSRFMLKTLDSKGNYQPVFADIQSLISYKTGKSSTLSLLLTYSSNTFNFIPQSRVSTFGSEVTAYRLFVLFDGKERDLYNTWNTDLIWEILGKNKFDHKILLSSFSTDEKEAFDIRGSYSLNTLDKAAGSENFSDSIMNIGVGSYLSHARNRLSAVIRSVSYIGHKDWNNFTLDLGVKVRNERFTDHIKEWTMIDSAGFSVPSNSDKLMMSSLISADNNVNNWLLNAYIGSSEKLGIGNYKLIFNTGVRCLSDSYTGEWLVSPRVSSSFIINSNISLWLAGGIYYQPPLYREMRFPDGSMNTRIHSQKSVHTVLGLNFDFMGWERPFRLRMEIYNKILDNIILYRLDNVRLIYTGENNARGYSRGIDIRLNGEFVQGAESWLSLSIMDSRLSMPLVTDDKFPSPSDQAVSMNIFFQDFLPGYPTWRAHINMAYATGLPIISPFNNRYDQFHRLPAYRRVDLGITKIIKSRNSNLSSVKILNRFEEIVAEMEVFNLLDINNTISYFWIKTLNNLSGQSRQFAIPDYLTGRCLNLKLMASF